MARVSFTFIVILILVGCTSSSVSPTTTTESALVVAPTVVEPTATSSPAEIADTGNPTEYTIQEYPVPPGTHPHDVAPAPDGTVWYTAQFTAGLGRLDPATGETHHIPLGVGSAPHGVIVGPDGAPWITDGGLNAIVRVDPTTEEVQIFPLPAGQRNANLNTAAFDGNGILWFTGQNGFYGHLDPSTGEMQVFDAPRGRGPYGITVTPDGSIYYAALASSYVGRIAPQTGEVTVLEPPTRDQGARRVWSDSQGRVWVSEWNAGQVAVYNPADDSWKEWKLPGNNPKAYAVYVDDHILVIHINSIGFWIIAG